MLIYVYDNQKGYCSALQEAAPEGLNFVCTGMGNLPYAETGGLVVFFLSDEIEFMDFIKLYSPDVNFILCGNGSVGSGISLLPNVKHANINLMREELVATILRIAEGYILKTPV
jgi:hypothetical protein